jgi:hypothetical protein
MMGFRSFGVNGLFLTDFKMYRPLSYFEKIPRIFSPRSKPCRAKAGKKTTKRRLYAHSRRTHGCDGRQFERGKAVLSAIFQNSGYGAF